MLNLDGWLWIDRLSDGLSDTGGRVYRDYARVYGMPPRQDAERLKRSLPSMFRHPAEGGIFVIMGAFLFCDGTGDFR